MKHLVTLASLLLAFHLQAKNPNLSFEDLCYRAEITAEVFAYDKSGKLLEKKREFEKSSYSKPWSSLEKKGKCVLTSTWTSVWDPKEAPLALHYELEVKETGKIELKVKQFDPPMYPDQLADNAKVLKEKTYDVTSMESILWESPLHKNPKLVTRFTVDLAFKDKPEDFPQMEISGRDITISDEEGSIWGHNISVKAPYVAMKTHRGTVALSYSKFPGSRLIGEASSRQIKVTDENGMIVLFKASTPFLPEGMRANIYGLFSKNKTDSIRNVYGNTSSDEGSFLEMLKELKKEKAQ